VPEATVEDQLCRSARAIRASRRAGKPFCLVVSIKDPHKPFFIESKSRPPPPNAARIGAARAAGPSERD